MGINIRRGTLLKVNNSLEGETIEMRVEKIISNKEPISDSAEIIYTDRKDGVLPDYDIRSDKWDYAIDAMDKVNKARISKREEYYKKREDEKTKGQPAQADTGTA